MNDSAASRPGSIPESPLILVVEDDSNCALVVTRRLENESMRVIQARNGREGLRMALEHQPDVIVSDWMMPLMDGPSLCEAIRGERSIASTYVIILSNRTERSERIEGLQRGADDYLAKEANHDELVARVQAGLRLRSLQKELERRARHDGLTGLLNVEAFRDELEIEIERARRFGHPLSVAMADLDDFKRINDEAGHSAGDAAIRHAAQLLSENSRQQDLTARVGGDEFAIAFIEAEAEEARRIMDRVARQLRDEPFRYEGETRSFGMSFGVAQLGRDGNTPSALLRVADEGLYEMKAAGKR
jgi:diguanylate cyclase (GGDEF)-like protein